MKFGSFKNIRRLWKDFLPLSVSDVTMAMGDPLVTVSLATLPKPETNLGALGIVKFLVVFFESPIIMILHASNTLSSCKESRTALLKFTGLACLFLTCTLALISLNPIFHFVANKLMGVSGELEESAKLVLYCLIPWPACIAWRRYVQGLLISVGVLSPIAYAGFFRLFILSATLALGYFLAWPGVYVAGIAMIFGVISETIVVSFVLLSHKNKITTKNVPIEQMAEAKVKSLFDVLKFYMPLAQTMIFVWGSRALLIAFIARSVDSLLSLAVWPAAWALIILFANSTRMIQQVIIKNKYKFHPFEFLFFALSVGLVLSFCLIFLGTTNIGHNALRYFVGNNNDLLQGVQTIVLLCFSIPIFVALQNAFQGFMISCGKTKQVNLATIFGVLFLLSFTIVGIYLNYSGYKVVALSMVFSLFTEVCLLAFFVPWKNHLSHYLTKAI